MGSHFIEPRLAFKILSKIMDRFFYSVIVGIHGGNVERFSHTENPILAVFRKQKTLEV